LALVAATLAVIPSLRPAGWDVTALPRVASNTPLGADARRIDPGFRTVQAGAYDGQFYWAIALDPLATGSIHRAVDEPSYRYGHPLYGWLGWIFSAGQGTAAAAALLAVGLASLGAAAAAAAGSPSGEAVPAGRASSSSQTRASSTRPHTTSRSRSAPP
jgi:hypothetical protein